MSVGNPWRGIASSKSQVSELKNWMPKHSEKAKCWGRAQSWWRPQRSEKPGWSAGDMRQWPKMAKGVLLLIF